MLHILLLILKIIGIILLVLLAILLSAVCLVFFVPLRYHAKVSAAGDVSSIQASGKFSWLLHIFSGEFTYQGGELKSHVHVLWREVHFKKKEKKKRKNKKKTQEKNIFKKICDMIRSYKETQENLAEFIADEIHVSAWKRTKQELLRLLRFIRPKHISARIHYGLEDPSATGKILAGLSVLYPFYGDKIQIIPNFEEKILEGEAVLKGTVKGIHAFIIAWNFFFDENIQKTIKDIQTWTER